MCDFSRSRFLLCDLAVGLLASVLLSRTLTGLLFGVGPINLRTFAGASVLLLVVAVLAAAVPAARAMRIDGSRVLRS